jgi:alanyl-tRNA synthetase
VDPPNDGNNPSFDGGDERSDGSDDNTVVNAPPRTSGPPASQQLLHTQYLAIFANTVRNCLLQLQESTIESFEDITRYYNNTQQIQIKVLEELCSISNKTGYNADRMEAVLDAANEKDVHHFEALNSKMDSLLQKMDAAWTENTTLREAYRASREETAELRAAVDTLTKKLDENIAITVPPSPETVTSSTAIEEMTMQLSHIQTDIQDILDAGHNPPGKRKQCTSGQDNEPTTPMNR